MYSFREMTHPETGLPRMYVVHNKSGATLLYNSGKVEYLTTPLHYKSECFAEWYKLSRIQRKAMYKEHLTKADFSKAMTALKKANVPQPYFSVLPMERVGAKCRLDTSGPTYTKTIPVGATITSVVEDCVVYDIPNKKEENPMNISMNTGGSLEQQQKGYLLGRIQSICWQHESDLRKAYNLENDTYPTTPEEYVKRIKDGLYEIKKPDVEEEGRKIYYERPFYYLRFRDPSKKPDRDGFDKAMEILYDARTATTDLIMVGDAQAGLAAVQKFETTKFK